MERFLLLAVLSLAVSPAFAATVYLRGGSTVTGTLLESGSREVVIQTDSGVQRISTTNIDHVDYNTGEAAPAAAPARPAAPSESYPPSRISVESEPRQTLSFLAGAGVPFGDLDLTGAGGGTQRNGDWGPLLGVQYSYRTSPSLALGLEADWIHRSYNDSLGSLPNAETLAWGDSGVFLGFLKAYFTSRGSARPFVLAGGGVSRSSTMLDATPVPGFVWADTQTGETRRLIDGAAWAPAATARLGVDVFSGSSTVFGFELGWTHVARRAYAVTNDGANLGLTTVRSTLDFVTFTGRWGFSFGEGAP